MPGSKRLRWARAPGFAFDSEDGIECDTPQKERRPACPDLGIQRGTRELDGGKRGSHGCATSNAAVRDGGTFVPGNLHQGIGLPPGLVTGFDWTDSFDHVAMRRPTGTLLVVFFTKGFLATEAVKVLCAVRWSRSTTPRPTPKGLLLASAALAGWRRFVPGTSRTPLPYLLLILTVTRLTEKIVYPSGLSALLYVRALALRQFQLIQPLPFLRGASDLGRHGKTSEFDTSVPLDFPCRRPGKNTWTTWHPRLSSL